MFEPPKLLPLHLRPGECLLVNESMCWLYKMVSVFPAALNHTGKDKRSPL